MPDKSAIEVITEVLREHRPSIASEVGPEPYWCGDDETDGCGSWNRTTHARWRDHLAAEIDKALGAQEVAREIVDTWPTDGPLDG